MRPHFNSVVQVAAAGLTDSSAKVRQEALQAVATLVQWVGEEPEIRVFRELVPSLLQVSSISTSLQDSEGAAPYHTEQSRPLSCISHSPFVLCACTPAFSMELPSH